MQTETKEYQEYLGNKYLPGRSIYMSKFFYPKIFKEFGKNGIIADLGCGYGEFLNYCKKKNRQSIGIDSNKQLIDICLKNGHQALVDNICELNGLKDKNIQHFISDNVLEHLSTPEIDTFFEKLSKLIPENGLFVCIVPGPKGFEKDPTHKTFVTKQLIENTISKYRLKIKKHYKHPINLGIVSRLLYLNMDVFVISRTKYQY